MKRRLITTTGLMLLSLALVFSGADRPAQAEEKPSSYSPVVIMEGFQSIMERMKAEKPKAMKRHMDLLDERYDLSHRHLPMA